MRWLALLSLLLVAGCVAPAAAPAPDADAAREPRPAPPVAWGAPEDALLRPGDKLRPQEMRVGANEAGMRGCTLDFVFTSPDGRDVYIGTASHCLAPDPRVDGSRQEHRVGDEWVTGPGVRATIAYCSWGAATGSATCPELPQHAPEHPNDFALLRVHDEDRAKVHPAVRAWGGPRALAEEPPARGALVRTYGNSFLRDGGLLQPDAHDAREGLVERADAWHALVRFQTPGVHGDSGSPVLDAEGRALGVLQTLRTQPPYTGMNGVVLLAPALDAMRALGGPEVVLATWDG